MSQTLDMLQQEHRVMTRLLDMLDRQVSLFENARSPDYQLVSEIIDYFRSFPDLYHHPKEDLVLMKLRQRDPEAASAVGDLEHEHENCSSLLDEFARLVVQVLLEAEIPRDRFAETARRFIDNERRHMKGEEKVFFPAAERSLTDQDWAQIDAVAAKFEDPLEEANLQHRFDTLRAQIDARG